MNVWGIIVTNVSILHHKGVIWHETFSLSMKDWDIIAINVTNVNILHCKGMIWPNTLGLHMKDWEIILINMNISPRIQAICSNMLN